MSVQVRTIQAVPLDIRAVVSDVKAEKRTFDLTWTTGADVVRFDWETGRRFIERLSTDPKHVRLDRLNSGAPLLDSHSAYSLAHQLGVVEDGSASVDGKTGRATVRFSKAEDDPDADKIFRKVLDKIIRNVSNGYRVHVFEDAGVDKRTKLPVLLATDWEPFEISMVSMGADAGSRVRSSKDVNTHPCIVRGNNLSLDAEAQLRRRLLNVRR